MNADGDGLTTRLAEGETNSNFCQGRVSQPVLMGLLQMVRKPQDTEVGSAILIAVLVSVAIAIGLVRAVRKLTKPIILPGTVSWIEELSTERYRPMLRLLSRDEIETLHRRPGFTPKAEASFRRARCRIYRSYLTSLSQDFNRVSVALKILMVESSNDRPDLAATLVRTRLAFHAALINAHLRAILYFLGIGSVDSSQLLRLFDCMRVELRTLAPESAVWGS